jgi:hypothetical protein
MLIFASFAQLYFHFHSDHLQNSIQIYLCTTMKKKKVLKNKDEASQGLYQALAAKQILFQRRTRQAQLKRVRFFFENWRRKRAKEFVPRTASPVAGRNVHYAS